MIKRREFIAGLGSAAVWPVVARAQQQNLPVIGYLDWFGPSRNAPVVVELRAGLAEAGFIEGMKSAFSDDRLQTMTAR